MVGIKVCPLSTTSLLEFLELLLSLESGVMDGLVCGTQCAKLASQQVHIVAVAAGSSFL